MLKSYGKFLVILLTSIYGDGAFCAATNRIVTKENSFISFFTSAVVASLSVGPAWESAGHNQTLTLAPDIQKTYTTNKPQNTIANYDFFLGIQKPLTTSLLGQVGLDIASTSNATLSGNIWDDADVQFNNYTYQYQITHSQIALRGKLLGDFAWPVIPWISAALGIGFNRAYDFTNTPLIYQAIPSPNFSERTVTTLSYALGIGIQAKLIKHWQGGIGCEFTNWGKSKLGAASNSTSGESLSLSHLYTYSVMFNLTYLANGYE